MQSATGMALTHPHDWLLEPLAEDPGFIRRAMFGCLAVYFRGRLVLVLAAKEAPWAGALIPVERDQHSSIQHDFPMLSPHPVLGKWLYLPETHDDFESIAMDLVERIRSCDPRFGVIPPLIKRKGR